METRKQVDENKNLFPNIFETVEFYECEAAINRLYDLFWFLSWKITSPPWRRLRAGETKILVTFSTFKQVVKIETGGRKRVLQDSGCIIYPYRLFTKFVAGSFSMFYFCGYISGGQTQVNYGLYRLKILHFGFSLADFFLSPVCYWWNRLS